MGSGPRGFGFRGFGFRGLGSHNSDMLGEDPQVQVGVKQGKTALSATGSRNPLAK